ncbi:MAG TPA: extracellular solute-binding protein, partial [Patescibacteria group bacterium]|nr:extracellular solute-binding protein [Patescibacteria group bacterium]
QPTVMRQAKPADIKQSPFRFLPIVLGLLALLGLVWFAATKFFGLGQTTTPTTTGTRTATSPAPVKQTTITYWGLWEPSPVMDQIIKDFQTQNPGTVVNYVQQSPKEYRERLQDALKRGQGPDIFRYHATWASMLRSDLSTLPPSVMSQQEYEQTFYPIAATQLKTTSGFVGIPLMYDGLGLYYNTQIFQTANLTPPTQWADLESSAKTLTVRSKSGAIDRAGVALGTTGNVDNFSDILALLIFQNGGDPSKPSSPLVQQSVQYYTNFAKSLRVWDDTLPSSTYAFATEKSAMMLAPSWRAFEVKTLNPALQFAIAPVPQLPGTSVTWASYWVEGVSKTSKNQDLSWKFLKYLSQKDTLQKLHDAAVQKHPRLFGEIYPRKDMASLLSTDPYAAAYLSDAPKATSWWMASRTFDNGFNDKIVKYYEDAINAVNAGQVTAAEALTTTELGVTQVLQQAAQ